MPKAEFFQSLDPTECYWLFNAMFHAYSDGKNEARSETASTWRKAAAEKRIKTRKQRGSDRVKVWIEHADVTDMRSALVLKSVATADVTAFTTAYSQQGVTNYVRS